MTAKDQSNSGKQQGSAVGPSGQATAASRYRAAVATAAVAGAISLIVAAVLLWNRFGLHPLSPLDPEGRTSGPLESAEFRALKAELKDNPRDDALKQRIREKDFQLRQAYFRRQALADRGRYVLLAGLAVFLAAGGYAAKLRSRSPMPSPVSDPQQQHIRFVRQARWSVAAVGVLLAGSAAVLALTGGGEKRPLQVLDRDTSRPKGLALGLWPRFRGPGGLGVSEYLNIPTAWNGKTGEGILWKTPVPLPGQNSPVVWQDRVFLTGATAKQREVYCFHAGSGRLLWRKEVVTSGSAAEPPEVMEDTGFAAPTAAVDAERVYAIFANGDAACFDHSGKQVWARSLGKPDNAYGHASSLLLNGNELLIQYDQAAAEDAKSALLALDVLTGKTLWELPRPVPKSWSTPIIIQTAGGRQIVTAADPWVISYDASTAEELWRANCLAGDVAPSPAFNGEMVFTVISGAKLAAIRPDGRGDVTNTHVAWTAEAGLPDISSPLASERFVFLATTGGIVTCYDAKDGRMLWEKDVDANFCSSPSLVADRVYLLSTDGAMVIFAAAEEYRQIARCELGEDSDTCPAFLDGRIFIRGEKNLYCIGASGP